MPVPNLDGINTTKPKLLITGASGLLGHSICETAKAYWSVFAVYRRNKPAVDGVVSFQLDLTDVEQTADLLFSVQPCAVIHAAAIAQVAACEQDPHRSELINVRVAGHLARQCARHGIHFIFTSTDLVFDGTQAPYKETDPPTPFCAYSTQKMRAEVIVRRYHPQSMICRLPLLFGLAPFAEDNFTVQMITAIDRSHPITLFVDEYRTPVDTLSAAGGLLAALNHTGQIWHLGGHTRVSRFTLGKMLAQEMSASTEMIRPISIKDSTFAIPRAPDCSLNSQRAYASGYTPIALRTALSKLVEQYRSGI